MNLIERVYGEPRNLQSTTAIIQEILRVLGACVTCETNSPGPTLFNCLDRCAILHVEDEDGSACLFRAALDEAGIGLSVYRVSDGEQALAFLHQAGIYQSARRPELVVLDLNMPRVDGWTVLRSVKEDEQLRDIPVVVLSTSHLPEDQARALVLGARRYLVKPIGFFDLVRVVESICADFLPQAVS